MAETTTPPTFYLNLSTLDTAKAETFYKALGFHPSPDWSTTTTKTFVLPAPNQSLAVMLHAHGVFKDFMRPETDIVDAHKATEALFAFSVDSKDAVDQYLSKAVKAGGQSDPYALKDYGAECGMYTRAFADLDGHIWEVLHIFPTEK